MHALATAHTTQIGSRFCRLNDFRRMVTATIAWIKLPVSGRPRHRHRLLALYESSCNLWLLPRAGLVAHTSGCRSLKEGSSQETLCRIRPFDGNYARLCRRCRWTQDQRTMRRQHTGGDRHGAGATWADRTRGDRDGPNDPIDRAWPARAGRRDRLHRRPSGTSEPEGDEGQQNRSARRRRLGAVGAHRVLQGGTRQIASSTRHTLGHSARGHLVEARVRLDNTIRGLCATLGIRLGVGQGERFLSRMRVAASVPGLAERSRRCSGPASAWSWKSGSWIVNSKRSAPPPGLPGLDEHPRRRCADIGCVRRSC